MAASQIEEKILGRLAKQTAHSNAILSASLYQVLGLTILLSRKVFKARRLRRLDTTRDTKSIQLYHQIIWMAREGLSITEVCILPYCQDGEQGPECRVMAAKLRASFYHLFCLFHNHPPVSQLSSRSYDSGSSPSTIRTPRAGDAQPPLSPSRLSNPLKGNVEGGRRSKRTVLRDPIPSMTSETSYITNPYAAGSAQTPPPTGPPPPIPQEARRTPTRPPGLTPINISASQASASFLLPPLNFVPMAREHFENAQHLATSLLSPANSLRLSVALEHAAFLMDCSKENERARRLARRTIKEVYASPEGLDDTEFADASELVKTLGGLVRRSANELTPRPSRDSMRSPNQRTPRAPPIDRTIAVSPVGRRNRTESRSQTRSNTRTPERLSTVPEVESTELSGEGQTQATLSPPVSRLSSRSRQPRASSATSATSDKESKRRVMEQAEEMSRQRSQSMHSAEGDPSQSRQPTPPEGYVSTPRAGSNRDGGNG